MSDLREEGVSFVGYEYKEIPASGERASFCLDGYQSFGWVPDERTSEQGSPGKGKLVLRRDRKLVNRTELTRLQRHFDACLRELDELERSRTANASLCAILVGLLGTGFLAGATFAVTGPVPNIPMCVGLSIPGFLGWILPWFLYRAMVRRRSRVVDELMERKYDEIDEVCQKGHDLLQ